MTDPLDFDGLVDMVVEWRPDEFGDPAKGTAAYIGDLYCGTVRRMVPLGWREWPQYKDATFQTDATTRAHYVNFYTAKESTPFRAWYSGDEDGYEIGYFATMAEGQSAICRRALDAILRAVLPHVLAVPREALEIVACKRQCLDNLMGNRDVAEAALVWLDKLTENTPLAEKDR